MLYTIPDYYKEFTCTADKCQDTCCAGWQIVIDEKSLEKYKNICKDSSKKGSLGFGFKMLTSIQWMRGTFRQDQNKRCAFLNRDNLCDLYKNLGEKSLCKTCRLYPRHIEEFEGLREITLSISCPEVARILMERTLPVTFLTYEKEGDEEFEDFDPFFFSILEDARNAMLHILQNRTLTIRERTTLILSMAHDMQVRINKQEMFECSGVIDKYQKDSALAWTREYLGSGYTKSGKKHMANGMVALNRELFEKLFQLELLCEDWNKQLQRTYRELFVEGKEHYDALCGEFAAWKQQNSNMEIHLEQLLVYFLYTYFPGAVYDGEVYAKVQMTVFCVWMIENLWMARWQCNGHTLQLDEIIELTYRFSREVEHSDTNLKQVESWMEKKWFLQ